MRVPHGITAPIIAAITALAAQARAESPSLTQRRAVEAAMLKANLHYQKNFTSGSAVWNRAVYHVGNLRAWQYLGLQRDLDYTVAWSAANIWTRGPEGAAHADAHCCGQVYLDLFRQDPQPVRAANIKTTMDALVGLPAATDDWSWIDAFFMAAPTFAKLGVIYNQSSYFSQAEAMYLHMRNTRQLFDPAHGLWYRDAAAKGRTGPNTPEFWGRGNGWVIAACARMLEELPAGDPRRAEFSGMLQTMAAALVPWQGEDGFWRSNIKIPNHFPNPETSATAFFTYAIAYGIHAGILDAATYTPVVMKAWNGMVATALHPSGKLGYVQSIGQDPRAATFEGHQDYGYGAFLLAGVEILKLLGGPPPVTALAATPPAATDADGNYAETVRLDGSGTVLRGAGPVRMTWWLDSTFLGEGATLDYSFPLGSHTVTLKIEHADDLPYTATTEVRVQPRAELLPTVTASGFQTGNPPAHVLDGNLSTRWSQQGVGQWLQLNLPQALPFDEVQIAFYFGETRRTFFDLVVSTDGTNWEQVFTGQSSGTSANLETFRFPSRNVRHLRYIGRGNSESTWNSVTEIRLPLAKSLDARDADANGLPDAWEIHHFGSIGQPAALQAAYLTGITGETENPAAPPALRIEPSSPGGPLQLLLETRAAFGPGYVGKIRKHRILTSPDMTPGSWQPLADTADIPADNLMHTLPLGLPNQRAAFFRATTWLETNNP